MRSVKVNVPNPSSEQIEFYLRAWDELENYHLQEDALDKLFFQMCPENVEMSDILLKVVALNDFYSTNIFSVYPETKSQGLFHQIQKEVTFCGLLHGAYA